MTAIYSHDHKLSPLVFCFRFAREQPAIVSMSSKISGLLHDRRSCPNQTFMRPDDNARRRADCAFASIFGEFGSGSIADFACHTMNGFQVVASQPLCYAFAAHERASALTQNVLNFASDARHGTSSVSWAVQRSSEAPRYPGSYRELKPQRTILCTVPYIPVDTSDARPNWRSVRGGGTVLPGPVNSQVLLKNLLSIFDSIGRNHLQPGLGDTQP